MGRQMQEDNTHPKQQKLPLPLCGPSGRPRFVTSPLSPKVAGQLDPAIHGADILSKIRQIADDVVWWDQFNRPDAGYAFLETAPEFDPMSYISQSLRDAGDCLGIMVGEAHQRWGEGRK